MLEELTEYGNNVKEEMEFTQSEIKKHLQGTIHGGEEAGIQTKDLEHKEGQSIQPEHSLVGGFGHHLPGRWGADQSGLVEGRDQNTGAPTAEPRTAAASQRRTPGQEAGRGSAKARESKGVCRVALLGASGGGPARN